MRKIIAAGNISEGVKKVIDHMIDEILLKHSHRHCLEIIGGGLKQTLIIVRRITWSIKKHKRLAFKVLILKERLVRKPGGEFKKVCRFSQFMTTRCTSALQPA